MPLLRCEIKNEYGLGDPELYQESGSDDPEALLEGVAMAGLVGVLRQIGDLAEFAAEVFHDLHEQIVATSARGHRLMLCVQQLEIEFPVVERAVLSQTTHSHLSRNAGIDWHPSNHLDQNLIMQQDMPRFILNSYEESRGPPQLFILDKFDVAGAGACLKRYSDPSLFKTNDSSFRTMESEIQREKKAQKTKKKGTRLMHTKTVNSFMKADEKSIPTSDPKSLSLKRARLKTRHVNSLTSRIGTSYMECINDSQIAVQKDIHGKYSFNSNKKSVEASPEVHEIMIDTSSREKNSKEIKQPQFIIKHNRTEEDTDGLEKQKGMNRIPESLLLPSDEVSKPSLVVGSRTSNDYCDFNVTEKLSKNVLHESEGMAELDMAGSGAGEIGNNVSKVDYDSELENYVDALTAMESEMEIDYQNRVPHKLNMESPGMSSNSNSDGGEKHAKITLSDLHSIQNSDGLIDSDGSLNEKCILDRVELSGNFTETEITEKNDDHTFECEKSLSFSSINLLEKISNKDLDTTSLSELPESMEEGTTVWPSVLSENMKENNMFMSSDSLKIVNESAKIMPSESPRTMEESAAVKESDVLSDIHESFCASYGPQSGSEKISKIYDGSGPLEIFDEDISASDDPNSMLSDKERGIESTTKSLDEGNLICTDDLLGSSSRLEETVIVGDAGNPDVLSDTPPTQVNNNGVLDSITTYNLIHENELFLESIVDGPSPDAHTHSSTCLVPEGTVYKNLSTGRSQDSLLHLVEEPTKLINHNVEIDDGVVKAPHFVGDSEHPRHEKLSEYIDGGIQNLHFPTKENEVFNETKECENPCPHLLEVASDTFNNKERDDSVVITKIPVDSFMAENNVSAFCSETSSNSIEDDKSFELNSISPSSQDTSGSEFKIQVESISGSEFKRHGSTQEPKDKIQVESGSDSEFKIQEESVSSSDFKIHGSTHELKNKIEVESISGSEFQIQEAQIEVESVSGSEFKVHDSTEELKNNKLSSPYDKTLGLPSEETFSLLCSKKENENTSSMLGREDHPSIVDMNNHDIIGSTDCSVALVPNSTQTDSLNNAELSYSHPDVSEVDMVLINPDRSDGSFAVEFQPSTPEGLKEPDVQQPQIIEKMETAVCLDNSCASSMNVLTEQITWDSANGNGSKKNDSDVSPCDAHHQSHSEVEETYNSPQPSSELHVKSLENITVANMDTQINLLPQNGSQDSVVDAPLPPLPPLQWRLGRLGSKMPFGATSDPTMTSRQSPTKSFHNSSAPVSLLENNRQPQVNDANSGSRQVVSSKPILFKSVTDDNKQHLSQQGDHGDEKIQSMSLYVPVPSSAMQDGLHQHNLYMSGGEMFYVPYPVTSEINPAQQNGKPRPSSILNRPKNPLIEAVASHDRSTLRKVSEMNLPKVKSKLEEKDTLLEQIRNQSFNLKSTSITKPQVNGPSTNLKLAAILEKANAIRQACVGSDEDDDGNWSDS